MSPLTLSLSHFLTFLAPPLYYNNTYNSPHKQPSRGTLVISASQFVSLGGWFGGERERERENDWRKAMLSSSEREKEKNGG